MEVSDRVRYECWPWPMFFFFFFCLYWPKPPSSSPLLLSVCLSVDYWTSTAAAWASHSAISLPYHTLSLSLWLTGIWSRGRGVKRKALVAVRDQGQHVTLTGQHSEVNTAHLWSPGRVVALEFLSRSGPSPFLLLHLLYSEWTIECYYFIPPWRG